jgi:hypothetical protein
MKAVATTSYLNVAIVQKSKRDRNLVFTIALVVARFVDSERRSLASVYVITNMGVFFITFPNRNN